MAIKQRISLEGSEEIQQKLEQLSKAIAKMGDDSAAGFKRASTEANRLGVEIGIVSGAVQALTNKFLSLAAAMQQAFSPSALVKGTAETGKALKDQADKVNLTITEWMKLAKATDEAGVSQDTVSAGIAKTAKAIADAKGGFVSLVPGTMVSTAKGAIAVMTDLAKQIAMLGNSAAAAKLGTAAFGENWKEIIKVLTGSKAAAGAADDVFDTLAKVDRALSPDQAEKAAQLAKGWEVLAKAIRAFKDQVGTVFLDSALLKAEWLIKLIDGSRELFKTWQALAEEKKAAFLEGLSDSPAEFAFKTLVAVGQTLAGLWRDVLVPAGNALANIALQISGSFDGVSRSQVAGFFVTAAIAAVGLSLALKGIALALAPVSLLISLFTGFGPVLLLLGGAAIVFWDQMMKGATAAGELIPQQLQQMAASFSKLFAGDFKGFWTDFSTAAATAFQTIKAALSQLIADTPWAQTLLDGIKQIAIDGPGAIALIAQSLIALGQAATTVANTINTIFGTNLTGTDIALLVIITQMTGGLQALASAATVAAAAMTGIGVVFGILATIIGGIPAAIVAVGIAIAGAVAWWVTFSDSGKAAVQAVGDSIDWLVNKIKEAGRWLGSLLPGGGSTPAPAEGHASGGLIGGRGSGTSDSNLAWVSRGEHIMPASAVRQPGVLALLEALRRTGGNLRGAMGGMGRFAAGGLIPRFAEGGLVGGGMGHLGTVDLRIDGGTVRVMAGASAVEQLSRLAVTRRMTSTGRKPGFVG